MKKITAVLLAALLLLAALSGCGGNKSWTGKHDVEIVIKDYDDPYFVLDINAPLNSFQYTDKDGSTTNERPELKKMTPIKVMLTARQADGSVYRRLDLSNLRTWRIAEETDSLPAE